MTNSGGRNDNTAPSLSMDTFMKMQMGDPVEVMHSIPTTILESLEKEVTSTNGQMQDFVKTLLQELVTKDVAKSVGTVMETNGVNNRVQTVGVEVSRNSTFHVEFPQNNANKKDSLQHEQVCF